MMRLILIPFGLFYGFVTWVRNKFFDWKILPSREFGLPVISIGNLSTGGTGKTPHIEYIVRLLNEKTHIATLSRGYKRKTKGFVVAGNQNGFEDLGDEACQLKNKFPGLIVAVDEQRVHGIENLLESKPELETILLDDAFQHRYVKPGISILLTDFYKLYANDYVLPAGSLREFKSGAKRADIIIVTKSPKVVSPITRRRIKKLLNPRDHQKLFFSYIRHGKLLPVPGIDYRPENICKFSSILLFAGIANTYPLEMYLKDKCGDLKTLLFPDHHQFTIQDINKLEEQFSTIISRNKIIVTTEKDMMRLRSPQLLDRIKHLPLCYIPVKVNINKEDREEFNQIILHYVEENRRNNSLH
ncbi:MAG: tetraacyldisaccharide 4'-kinase [Bacteroidales bacterium]|nr:tetraacyldisaccharide 4'-kinase [Bacteroidales bacterium]